MVVDSILPHAESGPNDHRKDTPPFSPSPSGVWTFWWIGWRKFWVSIWLHSESRRRLNISTAFNRESYLIKPRMKCFVVDITQLPFRIRNSYLEILNSKFRLQRAFVYQGFTDDIFWPTSDLGRIGHVVLVESPYEAHKVFLPQFKPFEFKWSVIFGLEEQTNKHNNGISGTNRRTISTD